MSDDLNNRFEYHPPKDENTVDAHQLVRDYALRISQVYSQLVPPGRELSTAITKIEEAMFWANAGIARNGGRA